MFELLLSVGGIKFPDTGYTGPGAQKLIRYDEENDVGYYGLVEQADFFNFDQIEAAGKTVMGGTATNRDTTNKWHKFWFKGKVIYSPQRTVRTVSTWNNLYAAGFMYGVDGNGAFPPAGAEVNQLTPIARTTNGKKNWFKIRSPRMSLVDPTGNPYVVPPATDPNVTKSEFSLTAERVIPTTGIKEPWGTSGMPGSLVWGTSSITGDTTSAIVGLVNSNAYSLNPASKTSGSRTWLPVVELLPEDFDPYPTVPDSGPGHKKLVEYEPATTTGYFGRIAAADMPGIDLIESAAAITLGGVRTAFASNITWTKYTKNGKVFYYPDNSIRSGITWDNIYQAGFVYGTNDNGKFPEANTPTNQLRKFVFTDRDGIAWEFKVRLPQLVTIDKFADSQLSNSTFARESEFSTTFARTHGFNNCPVIWDNIAKPLSGALGTETNSNFAAQSNYVSTAFNWGVFSRQAKGTSIGQCQWFPVLELVGKV